MLGLTLMRPWEQAVFFLGKDDENRKWHPAEKVRGQRIALHAGKGYDGPGAQFILSIAPKDETEYERWVERIVASADTASKIIGTARVTGWRRVGETEVEQPHGWAFGPWVWSLADKFVLPVPVPCKGALGLWRLPADVETQVLAQEMANVR